MYMYVYMYIFIYTNIYIYTSRVLQILFAGDLWPTQPANDCVIQLQRNLKRRNSKFGV